MPVAKSELFCYSEWLSPFIPLAITDFHFAPSNPCVSQFPDPRKFWREKLLTWALLTWASQVTLVIKTLPANVRDMRDVGLIPDVGLERSPWRRAWQPTPVFLHGESPWIEEPGGLQARGLQRIGHSWRDLAHTHGYTGIGSLVVAT